MELCMVIGDVADYDANFIKSYIGDKLEHFEYKDGDVKFYARGELEELGRISRTCALYGRHVSVILIGYAEGEGGDQ